MMSDKQYCVKFRVGDGYYFHDYTKMFDRHDEALMFAKSITLTFEHFKGLFDKKFQCLAEVKVVSFQEEIIKDEDVK